MAYTVHLRPSTPFKLYKNVNSNCATYLHNMFSVLLNFIVILRAKFPFFAIEPIAFAF